MRLIGISLTLSLLTAPAMAQVDPFQTPAFTDGSAHSYQDDLPEPGRKVVKKKKPRIKGFSREKELFQGMCAAIERDGRIEWFSDATGKVYRDRLYPDECYACKQFFRAFSRYCQPTDEKKPKLQKVSDDDAEEAPVEEAPRDYKQREPRLEAIDYASRLFRTLFDDEDQREQTGKAVKEWLALLRKEEGKSRAAQEYFDILAAYAEAPFKRYWEEKARVEEALRLEREQKEREYKLETQIFFQ